MGLFWVYDIGCIYRSCCLHSDFTSGVSALDNQNLNPGIQKQQVHLENFT